MTPHQDESSLIPDESQLINQFAKGNGSVFVGAGLSIGAGLPSWEELVRPLAGQINCPQSTAFLDIAQYYVNVNDEITLVDHVRQALSKPGAGPTEVHRELIKLPVPRIFTTNLDNLLEVAFHERDLKFDTIVTDQDVALMDSGKKSIVKLHGDINQTASWVITSEHYENYFSKHPGIANLLGMDLHSRTVLFLGYSFNDIDMRMILSQVKRVAADFQKNLFAVQFNPTPLEVEELKRRKIKVIGLRAKPKEFNQALKQWLENFIRRVRESRVLHPVARQFFLLDFINGNLPSRSAGLVDRAADRDRVMNGLRSRYPLISIKGFAGVGKTSLAIEVGANCSLSRRPPDADAVIFEYIVWISAKDKPDQKRWLDDVLNEIARTTSNIAITQLPSKKEKERQVSQILGCYKTLVIIDNFETIEDPELIEWLERLPYPSKALITSRSRPERIAAWTVNLRGLETADASRLLRQHETLVEGEEDRTLDDLVRVTSGNPQAMKLALGLVRGGIVDLKQIVHQLDNSGKPETILQVLLSMVWEGLSEPAQEILLVTPLFVGVSSIRRDALDAATGLPFHDFKQGLHQCLEIALLEEAHEPERFVIHSKTRDFAREELDGRPAWEHEAMHRCTEYFREFVRRRVVRPRPEPPYWNALVSARMAELNPEWPSIQQVMNWADEDGQDEILVELVMLLVHYMDSQFLNLDRLKYVEKAVAALQRMGRQEEEALLRIDALGWTYVEVLKLNKAYRQIFRGFELARGEDLRALGLAWRARVRVERKQFDRADELIREALAIDCNPWIKFRVNMAAGDIALKRGGLEDARDALGLYQRAAKEADSYGGEGYGYQIGPRIGLAYLGVGEIDEAERKFKELSDLEQIPIGKLYAEYGLALVARERGHLSEALLMLNDVKAKICRYTSSNLLLRLIEEQAVRMGGSPGAGI
jgi:LuxR family glucitol operon transcriptional activator